MFRKVLQVMIVFVMALALTACGGGGGKGGGASKDIGNPATWGGAQGESAGVINRNAATKDSTPVTALYGVWHNEGLEEIEFVRDGTFITRFQERSNTASWGYPAGDVRVFIAGDGVWDGPWSFDIKGDTLNLTDNVGGVRTYKKGRAPK